MRKRFILLYCSILYLFSIIIIFIPNFELNSIVLFILCLIAICLINASLLISFPILRDYIIERKRINKQKQIERLEKRLKKLKE